MYTCNQFNNFKPVKYNLTSKQFFCKFTGRINMPVFEYKCSDCESKFEILTKSNNEINVSCPECDSSKAKKLFSTFNASMGSTSYADSCCDTDNCNADVPGIGGCANGMCGLN